MIRNLDWIRELDVSYDASTFDTDPFEPQPEGVGTIFPFWVEGLGARPGYVELPYTLPQDHTLFVLLEEKTTEIWRRKLAWLVAHQGMALCDVHPCYADPEGQSVSRGSYPLSFYEEFLKHIKNEYEGRYWHALPRDLANWWRSEYCAKRSSAPIEKRARPPVKTPASKIWIDLDNTPHVPLFKPIIRELKAKGYEVLVTARDAFQVWELADRMGVECAKIGRHYGKHRLIKGMGLCYRAAQLAPLILREKPTLAVSHGSRSQVILSSLLRIPCVLLSDYEHARELPLFRPTHHLTPDVIPDSAVPGPCEHLFHYPGIKENVYTPDFIPDLSLMHDLGLSPADTIVTVRPPATEAHYRAPLSDTLFDATMTSLLALPGIRIILVPRNKKQLELLKMTNPQWFTGQKIIVPPHALDGLNLLWHSDVVISGGGTMNREAAALGVPVYSIFGGSVGCVDQYLSNIGKLTFIRNPADLPGQLNIRKRDKTLPAVDSDRQTLQSIVSCIINIAEHPSSSQARPASQMSPRPCPPPTL
jgi:predicted glycosyltransferase